MIVATLTEFQNHYYVKIIGHSGNRHESIVCASVSVLAETWRLSEIALEHAKEIVSQDGLLEASISKTTVSQILFSHLCIGLIAIQKQYPNEISLNIGG